jgi:hypothetical protein
MVITAGKSRGLISFHAPILGYEFDSDFILGEVPPVITTSTCFMLTMMAVSSESQCQTLTTNCEHMFPKKRI